MRFLALSINSWILLLFAASATLAASAAFAASTLAASAVLSAASAAELAALFALSAAGVTGSFLLQPASPRASTAVKVRSSVLFFIMVVPIGFSIYCRHMLRYGLALRHGV